MLAVIVTSWEAHVAAQATQSDVASAVLRDDDNQGRSQRWRGTGWVGRTVPLLSVIVFLAIWQIVGSHINPILLATPTATARAFWDLAVNGELGPAFATAMGDLAAGFALAAIVGVGFGIVLGRNRLAERIMNPYINFFQATPLIALVPLVVIWFGVGFESRVAVTFLLAVWSILINTATGVKNASAALRDVGRIYKFSPRQVVMSIELPSAVPSIFAGLRIALGKALIGMVIAQMEISVTGIGGLVVNYGNAFRTAYLLAAIVTASAVGVVAAILLELIRRWLFPWTEGEDIGRW
jgi:NitT/TauT family transport system permease protein